jgi:branched-chain amino acid transport system ATP-binding protein
MLEVHNLTVRYGGVVAVDQISLHAAEGEVVTLIGANGAGKSTTIRAISRMLDPASGTIAFDGSDITNLKAHEAVRRGISECPEGRRVLARQTVRTNLELGAYVRRDTAAIAADIDRMMDMFPVLRDRTSQIAGTLSGGEQQMLAIGRSLMSRPRLLLLDEPSLGIAPIIVRQIFETIDKLRAEGMTIVLVEQNAGLALQHADRAYVLEAGRVTLEGPASELLDDDRVRRAYLG